MTSVDFILPGRGSSSSCSLQEMQLRLREAAASADRNGWAMTYAILHLDGLQELLEPTRLAVFQSVFRRTVDLLSGLDLPGGFPAFAFGARILLILPGALDLSVEVGEFLRKSVSAGRSSHGEQGVGPTLSIGLACTEDFHTADWNVLLQKAAARAQSAVAHGGDQVVHCDTVSATAGSHPVANSMEPMTSGSEAAAASSPSSNDHHAFERRIKILERRIQKLGHALKQTEGELEKASRSTSTDPGLASEYRVVQGLSEAEGSHALKLELMSALFEANLELRNNRPSTPNR